MTPARPHWIPPRRCRRNVGHALAKECDLHTAAFAAIVEDLKIEQPSLKL